MFVAADVSGSNERQLVVFRVGDNEFGISISVVREIINETKAVKLPRMPSFVVGVLNLRGSVVPVVDLAERLGMEGGAIEGESRKILIVETGNNQAGYLVSAVTEVLRVPADSLEQPTRMLAGLDTGLVESICKLEDRMFPVLGTEQLLEMNQAQQLDAFVEESQEAVLQG